jgi:hypothetical protein
MASYYASVLAVAAQLKPFRDENEGGSRRLRTLCWTPYFNDGILAGVGGLLNPAGLFYILTAWIATAVIASLMFIFVLGRGTRSRPHVVAVIANFIRWLRRWQSRSRAKKRHGSGKPLPVSAIVCTASAWRPTAPMPGGQD